MSDLSNVRINGQRLWDSLMNRRLEAGQMVIFVKVEE